MIDYVQIGATLILVAGLFGQLALSWSWTRSHRCELSSGLWRELSDSVRLAWPGSLGLFACFLVTTLHMDGSVTRGLIVMLVVASCALPVMANIFYLPAMSRYYRKYRS